MSVGSEKFDIESVREILKHLDERLTRIEVKLGLSVENQIFIQEENKPADPVKLSDLQDEDELEFKVGQNWFAKVGIVALALGIAFLLTFPYQGLPAAAPGIFGFFLSIGVFFLSHLWRKSFDLVSRYLRGAAMVLLFFTTLRLYFFSQNPALSMSSALGIVLMLIIVGINLFISFKRKSSYLASLAITMGYVASMILGPFELYLTLAMVMSIISVFGYWKYYWKGFYIYSIALNYLIFLIIIFNIHLFKNDAIVGNMPENGIHFELIQMIIFAVGTLFRDKNCSEPMENIISTVINGIVGFGIYAGFSLVELRPSLTFNQVIASLILIGLAILFWIYKRSQYSTFIYSMLGYCALSIAILSAFDVPNLFVWLSMQSLIVVATAVWFRSRFIVVANFVIYIVIVIGYVIAAQSESGISIGFGIVALLSARILNWQKKRLELKTDIMRVAYLVSAFMVFPYAMYHLVPHEYVALSWIGIAMFYYLMNLIIRNQKYRWMGHLTLMLTVLYALVVGIIQLEPVYRILSFLVLGIVLLAISLIFTRLRNRQQKMKSEESSITRT